MPNKVGRPKNYRPHEIRLQLPKHPLKYQAKRLYWALLEMEKKMAKDITSVKMSEYTALLTSYTDVCEKLKKEGITYGSKTKQRMGQGSTPESDSERSGEAGTGENRPANLGARVRTSNPIT